MGTPNFRTQDNFPLYVHNLDFYLYDPETEEETGYDECEAQDFCDGVQRGIDKINNDFDWHKITLKGGYYAGCQFYVEAKESRADLEEMDNRESNRDYGECKSKVLRRYDSEQNKVKKALAKLAKEYCFVQLSCVGIFSNGEAVYERVA